MEQRISGSFVKKLRESKLMTQEKFAEACGFNLRTLQRIESTGKASNQSIRAIAEAFDIAVTDLAQQGHKSFIGELQSFVRRSFGIALLWVALAALVYVPTSEGDEITTIVAILGFVSFAVSYWCLWIKPSE